MSSSSQALQVLTVCCDISPKALSNLQGHFQKVHYYPDAESVTEQVMVETDIWFTRWTGLSEKIVDIKQIPRTRIVQLASAGANKALNHPVIASEEGRKQIQVCSASGIHSLSIPQWCVAQIINIYMGITHWNHFLQTENRWPSMEERKSQAPGPIGQGAPKGSASLYGKTVGMLGYGHIAREAARQLRVFNVDVIAANSAGQAKVDDGYIIEGTGDKNGTIPSTYYSTTDQESFKSFLKRCDILIASLPSTPQTQWMLQPEHLALLPTGAVFLNVGRGDLVHTDDLLEALDSSSGLYAAALDVTDPEPLPDHSPLFSHPRVFITPHTSGDFAGYFDAGTDLLIENVKRVRAGRGAFNVVDPEKGY